MTNWNTQEAYESFEDEIFEGEIRKLGELIAQLELWSDTKTINHKMEQVRLEEFVELDTNLYTLYHKLTSFIEANQLIDETLSSHYGQIVSEKFQTYQETEETIWNWIKDIKEIHILIAKSPLLTTYRTRLEEIINH